MKTIGVDVGGTFTDIIYCDLISHQIAIHKVSTTPDDPSRAVIQGIGELCRANGIAANDIDRPAGRLTYTQMLNSRGGIECRATGNCPGAGPA